MSDRPGSATEVEIAVEAEAEAVTKTGPDSRHPLLSHGVRVIFEWTATGAEQSERETGGQHQHAISEAGRWRNRQSYYHGGDRESDAARYH
jgi:hypothetical protein